MRIGVGDFNLGFREESICGDDEGDVDDGVEGVFKGRGEWVRGGYVVGDIGDGV